MCGNVKSQCAKNQESFNEYHSKNNRCEFIDVLLGIEKTLEDIGSLFGGGGNPIHIVLLVCLRVENSNPVKQLVVVVRLVRIEGNADSNPRNGKQFCALAGMLKIWGSEGRQAVVFTVSMGAEQQGKRRLLLKFFLCRFPDLSIGGSEEIKYHLSLC